MGARRRSNGKRKNGRRRGEPAWVDLPDDELLDVRFCDLGLKIEDTWLAAMVTRLYEELARKGLRFKPHVWLSNEWFSPDDVPGIAIPFYLAHPRLMRLERNQVLEVEGGTKSWCMKILRHEAGHAIDTAYRLRFKHSYRKHFGKPSQPYPDTYRPKPGSRKHVLHLEWWYAQSHPLEDFAETFAVWLRPGSRWRSEYGGWPVMKKLDYVSEVMRSIADKPAVVRSRAHVDSLPKTKRTLREHYATKRGRYGVSLPDYYDLHLRRLFVDATQRNGKEKAATFLRRHARELRNTVSQWTGHHPYTIDQFLKEMRLRSRLMDLRVEGSVRQAKMDTAVLLTVQVMRYLHGGGYHISL
ncbi:MAG: putative zinc-binding metallopeptidase [Planctomycetota bacterium]|nr:putative zinc-binding metallopeptidase [Planctomycetota bacterium]